jgi:hypothetical protein
MSTAPHPYPVEGGHGKVIKVIWQEISLFLLPRPLKKLRPLRVVVYI